MLIATKIIWGKKFNWGYKKDTMEVNGANFNFWSIYSKIVIF